jgi:tyrosyl-tRNA synthetase
MSSSDPDSKIDLLDEASTVNSKIKKAFCEEGNVENNGLLAFAKQVIFSVWHIKGRDSFTIKRDLKYGGDISFSSYEELESAFAQKKLYPLDLKLGMADAINELLEPIRAEFNSSKEMQELTKKAYPSAGKAAQEGGDSLVDEFAKLDLKVGKVVSVESHPESDALLVCQVDIGASDTRSVVAGLAQFIARDKILDSQVVLATNLKPTKFKGVLSNAMILAAQKGEKVELLRPAAGSKVGEQVMVEGITSAPEDQLNPKKKILEKVLESVTTLKVAESKKIHVIYRDDPLTTSAGPVCVDSLEHAYVK